ncbi:MAG TPA: Asp-tRNA(Asn)/Glu-tRNA(Gln) amidotransferase subunit GatC [Polyangiaceae bacterium]|nr:Asp-tRNA(Asn)/Glu-tRNA(Gln) amidotransferase subunit GatC [Polyangiaceae bacterium]
MALSTPEVLHIARLANLALSPSEVTQLTNDLTAILAHIDELGEVDTSDVPATTHVAVLAMPLRPDVHVPGLSEEAATGGAARVVGGAFAVPRFVEE